MPSSADYHCNTTKIDRVEQPRTVGAEECRVVPSSADYHCNTTKIDTVEQPRTVGAEECRVVPTTIAIPLK